MFTSWAAEIRTPFIGRLVATCVDPRVVALVLEHEVRRLLREAKRSLCPVTTSAIWAERERLEKMLALVRAVIPPRRKPYQAIAGPTRGRPGVFREARRRGDEPLRAM